MTTATLLSQRAKPSPLWSRLCPETRIGRGLARIARVLWGKASCGAGIACPPPRTARRGAAPEGEEVVRATPCLLALVRHRAGGGGAPVNSHHLPSPSVQGRSLHSDPWRKGHQGYLCGGRILTRKRCPTVGVHCRHQSTLHAVLLRACQRKPSNLRELLSQSKRTHYSDGPSTRPREFEIGFEKTKEHISRNLMEIIESLDSLGGQR